MVFVTFPIFCVLIFLIQFIWFVIPWIKKHLIFPYCNPTIDVKKNGNWAVITGSSSGIGKEFAKQFAARGLNIVLMSRTREMLENVAEEIREKFKVQTKIIVVDFSKGFEIYKEIGDTLNELDIGVLVNNVGMGPPNPKRFHELVELHHLVEDVLNVNIVSTIQMTKLVLKSMLIKRRGLIINVCSLSSMNLYPFSLYSASKAFIRKFTEDLAFEYQDTGVIFQSINPGSISKNKTSDSDWFNPDAETFVISAMRSIGAGIHTIGWPPHVLSSIMSKIQLYISPSTYREDILTKI